MAEGDVYTDMMYMFWWSNNRSCGVVVSEYMSIWVLYSIIYNSVCRYGMYCIVWYGMAQYSMRIMCNSIYQYVNYVVMCATEWQNTFDTLTEWQSNDRTLSKCLYDSLPVCQIRKQLAICCCLLLSLAILYLCAISVSAFCYLGRSFLLCCCECSVLSLWEFLFSGVVMFGVVSGDSVVLIRLHYWISYCLIFIIYYFL